MDSRRWSESEKVWMGFMRLSLRNNAKLVLTQWWINRLHSMRETINCWKSTTLHTDFLVVAQHPKSELGRLIVEFLRSNTIKNMHTQWTPLNEWLARRWSRLVHNTQWTQEKKLFTFSGHRTQDFISQVAATMRLRLHVNRDRLHGASCLHICTYIYIYARVCVCVGIYTQRKT
jgi:hypothetical protein